MSVELVSLMKLSTIAVVGLVLLSAGLATGVITTISRNRDLTEQLEEAQAARSQPAPATDAGRLRQLLDEQEAANAVLRDEIAQLKLSATNNTPLRAESARASGPDQSRNPGRGPGNAWLDRLKQEDPERYKQIVQQREERRKAMDQRYQETLDQLDARAQSAPTQVEADLVGQIADTLAKLNDLRQQWQAIRNLPEDQQQAQSPDLAAQMRQTTDQLRDLSQQDRTLQLQNFARSLGVTDDNGLQNFVNGVTTIYSNTNFRAIVGGGFGGGGPGGPLPGPGNTPAPTPRSSRPPSPNP
jgi:hypothetical protein